MYRGRKVEPTPKCWGISARAMFILGLRELRPQGAFTILCSSGYFTIFQINAPLTMADLLSYLPPFEGLLPKWLFLVRPTLATQINKYLATVNTNKTRSP